jgi:hypothetical protein
LSIITSGSLLPELIRFPAELFRDNTSEYVPPDGKSNKWAVHLVQMLVHFAVVLSVSSHFGMDGHSGPVLLLAESAALVQVFLDTAGFLYQVSVLPDTIFSHNLSL